MNNLKIYIAAVVSTVLTTPAALATDSISTYAASNYFDANWTLFNTDSRPLQSQTRVFEDISTWYFDSNWFLINHSGKSHLASTATHANHDMTQEKVKTDGND